MSPTWYWSLWRRDTLNDGINSDLTFTLAYCGNPTRKRGKSTLNLPLAYALVVLHIFMLPLPSGLSRRERQLAGYIRTLRNTFPEHSWLSVGPVPAGARLAG